MESYRVCKSTYHVDSCSPFGDDIKPICENNVIENYEVQVRGLFFWHTVKSFKKIMPAVRLLHHLISLSE